jgi:hypothetical protein
MGDWTPIHRVSPTTGQAPGIVRITPNGVLMISADIATRFHPHTRVQPLRNGNTALIGLRAEAGGRTTGTLAISSTSRVSIGISFGGTLRTASKTPPSRAVELPHHWDGDVLVLDLSGLPDAPGGR